MPTVTFKIRHTWLFWLAAFVAVAADLLTEQMVRLAVESKSSL